MSFKPRKRRTHLEARRDEREAWVECWLAVRRRVERKLGEDAAQSILDTTVDEMVRFRRSLMAGDFPEERESLRTMLVRELALLDAREKR